MAALSVEQPPCGGRAARGAARAEHKQVTVLFADVQGSMAISERLDPEEWYRMMVRFFVVLADGVQRFGGVVNRFTGDGIMALFGAPVAQEDHAQRACHAALSLKRALVRYATELRESRGVDLGVRIGINSGDVVAATLGGEGPTNYTALGHTVHLAAAMERLAQPGCVLLSERTARLVDGYFRLADVGERCERIGDRPVRVFELLGAGAYDTRLDRSRSRGLSCFVGRASEMRFLERGLEEARSGRGAVIGVRGEVGVGKSRLCQEFLERGRSDGVTVYRWRILSHLRATPFLSLITDLRRMFEIRVDDEKERARGRIDAHLRAMGGDAPALAPYLAQLLGVSERRIESESYQIERLKPLIAGFTAALGSRRPAVILIEDVQWIDSASGKVLDVFLETITGTRVLAVLNFRPEHRSRAPRLSCYQELSLAPLGRRATSELLRQLLGEDPALDELAAEIRERTRGNPFFIEELVTMLAEVGVLVGKRGAYARGPNRELAQLPSSLQALLESRIDLLAPREKRVLQAAAVVGKTFCVPLLRRVTGLSADELGEALRELRAAEFLTDGDPSEDGHDTFRHPLMQEEAYYSQVSEERAAAHAEVARACIEVYAGRLDERASLVAHHWECAGDLLQAARWGQRAAAWITQRNLNEGLRRWRSVSALLDRAPASAETYALGVQARIKTLEIGARLGLSGKEAARVFNEARTLAMAHPNARTSALLHAAYGQARGFVGEIGEALELHREAARLAETSGDQRLVLRLNVSLTYAAITAGRFREALALCERLLAENAHGTSDPSHRPMAYLRFFHAMLCVDMGRPAEARADLRMAADLAWQHADVELLSQVYGFEPVMTRMLGADPEEAFLRAQRAVELAEHLGSPFARVFAYWGFGGAHLLRGDARTSARILNGVLLLARDHGVALHGEAGILADLALATMVRGDGAVALSIAEEAVEAARKRAVGLYECIAQLARVYVLLETKGADAEGDVHAGIARVRALIAADGLTSFEAVVHLHLATLARLRRDHQREEVELRAARALYARMGATDWVRQLDGRLGNEAAA
ncbi:MAG: adenylate/guanylate cyclase domain-containing protein [Thermodesulfobacteriota bacterium]